MDIKAMIKNAIDTKSIVSFEYKNHTRVAEPYHYGRLIRTPQYISINPPRENYFLCYQVGGTSESGKLDYKSMDICLINNFQVLNDTFTIRDDYDPNDRQWDVEYGVIRAPSYKP